MGDQSMKNIYFYCNYNKSIAMVFDENHNPEKISLSDESSVDYFEKEHEINLVEMMVDLKVKKNYSFFLNELFSKIILGILKDVGAIPLDNIFLTFDIDSEALAKCPPYFSDYKFKLISIFDVFDKYSSLMPSFNGINFNFDFSSMGPNDKKIIGGSFWSILDKIRVEHFNDDNVENNEKIFHKCREKYIELLATLRSKSGSGEDFRDDIAHLSILKTLAGSEKYKGKTIYKSGLTECFPLIKDDFIDRDDLKEISDLFKNYALLNESNIILEAQVRQSEILRREQEEKRRQEIEVRRKEEEINKGKKTPQKEETAAGGNTDDKDAKDDDENEKKNNKRKLISKFIVNFLKFAFALLIIGPLYYFLALTPNLFESGEFNHLAFQFAGHSVAAILLISAFSFTNKVFYKFISVAAVSGIYYYVCDSFLIGCYSSLGFDIPFESTFWLSAIPFITSILPLLLLGGNYLRICKTALLTVFNNVFSAVAVILIYLIVSLSVLEFTSAVDSLAVYRSRRQNIEMLKKVAIGAGVVVAASYMTPLVGSTTVLKYLPMAVNLYKTVKILKSKIELVMTFIELGKQIRQFDKENPFSSIDDILKAGKKIPQLKDYANACQKVIDEYEKFAIEARKILDSLESIGINSQLSAEYKTIISKKCEELQVKISSIGEDKSKIEEKIFKLLKDEEKENNKTPANSIHNSNMPKKSSPEGSNPVVLKHPDKTEVAEAAESRETLINKVISVNDGSDEIAAAVGKDIVPVNKSVGEAELLFKAVSNNDTSEIAALLKKGIAVDATNENGMSPLMSAVKNGSMEAVGLLLEASDIELRNDKKINALGMAVTANNIEIARLLIEKGGAAVNCYLCNDNQTPLMLAIGKYEVEMARLLIEKNASLTATNKYGWTPLAYALYKKDAEMVKLLLDKKWDPASDVNVKIGEYTLLMMAVNYDCDAEIIAALLNSGADIKTKTKKGLTVLDIAKNKNNKIYNLLKNFKRR